MPRIVSGASALTAGRRAGLAQAADEVSPLNPRKAGLRLRDAPWLTVMGVLPGVLPGLAANNTMPPASKSSPVTISPY